jgi:hypothetical protein
VACQQAELIELIKPITNKLFFTCIWFTFVVCKQNYVMQALRTIITPHTSKVQIIIPDEMKNQELEVIILPVTKNTKNHFEFWSDEELIKLQGVNLASSLNDNEDYSKW